MTKRSASSFGTRPVRLLGSHFQFARYCDGFGPLWQNAAWPCQTSAPAGCAELSSGKNRWLCGKPSRNSTVNLRRQAARAKSLVPGQHSHSSATFVCAPPPQIHVWRERGVFGRTGQRGGITIPGWPPTLAQCLCAVILWRRALFSQPPSPFVAAPSSSVLPRLAPANPECYYKAQFDFSGQKVRNLRAKAIRTISRPQNAPPSVISMGHRV